jgi:hypothetical protein
MKKRAFIIHGWSMSPDDGWYPWLGRELKRDDFEVIIPKMPDTDNPKIEAWTNYMREKVGQCNENTFFVGHSIGCQAIMRYLEKLPEKEKAGGVVFVAPWLILSNIEGQEERMTSSPWLNTPIDFEKVKSHAKKIICIFSDNDPYVPAENWEMFSKNLGAETITEKGQGHFTDDDGITELPAAAEELLKISRL